MKKNTSNASSVSVDLTSGDKFGSIVELKSSEKKYRKLFETANDAIFMMTADKFVDCNPQTLKMFGCATKADIIGHHPSEFSPEFQPDGKRSTTQARRLINAALDGKSQHFYWKHTKLDGSLFDAEVSLNKLVLEGEEYLQAIVRDVSPQKEVERSLVESESKFKAVVENSQSIIFLLDENLHFMLSEGKELSVLGLKPGEVVGQSALDIYKDYPVVLKHLKSALGGTFVRDNIQIQDVYFDAFFSPWKDKDGNARVIGMAHDITQQEIAKKRLQEIDKLKTQFLSTASHQLRSPLGTMRWKLEMLLESKEKENCPELYASMKDVYELNLRVVNLVNSLLDVSRIEQGELQTHAEELDISALIEEILEELAERAKAKDLAIVKNIAECKHVFADKNQIREALQNVFSNAIKYNKKQGCIRIDLAQNNGSLILHVYNTGVTIPENEHHRVFEKFFRAESAKNLDVEGSGLGLFVTKSYIEAAGGSITFASPIEFTPTIEDSHPVEGTLFTISLPVKE